jgi:hypothetical protein
VEALVLERAEEQVAMRTDDRPGACLVTPDDGAGRLDIEHVAEADVERGADARERGERDRAEAAFELADEAAGETRCFREVGDRQPALQPNGAQPLADTSLGDILRGQESSLYRRV